MLEIGIHGFVPMLFERILLIHSRTNKVLALSMGQTMVSLVGLLSGAVTARLLTKQDYATWKQTFLAYEFAAPLLVLGLYSAPYYFLPRSKGDERGIIIDSLVLLLVMGMVFSAFLFCGGTSLLALRFSNPDLQQTLKWLVLYPLYVMPVGILSGVLVSKGRTTALSIYNVLSAVVLVTGIILATFMTRSFSGPLAVRVLWPVCLLPISLWLIFSMVRGPWRLPRLASMAAMLKYSVPLGLATIMGTATLQLDKIIVSSMCKPEDLAVYINGALEIPLIGILTGSISTVMLAEMAELCQRRDYLGALELFHKASLKSAAVLLPTMCFLLVSGGALMIFLFSSKYAASVVPFRIFLLILPIRVVFYGPVLMALGLSRRVLTNSALTLAVSALLSFLFVPMIGYVGAAVSLVLALYLFTVPCYLYHIARGFGISSLNVLPFKALGRILWISGVVSLLPLAAVLLLRSAHVVVQLAVGGLVYWPLVLWWLHREDYLHIPPSIVLRLHPLLPRKKDNPV